MISGHPALAELFTIDRNWKKLGPFGQLKAEWGLLKQLKARQYDLVIHLTEHKRGAWLTRFLKPRYAVARSGNYGKLFTKAFTHRYPVVGGNRRHTVELHLDALRRIGLQPARDERRLTLVPGAEAEAAIAAKLAEFGLKGGDFILIHPTSRWLFKTWPAEHMAAFIDRLTADGHQVVLTAAPDPAELAMLDDIRARLLRPVHSLAGQLSLKQLAALIGQARLFVGMDSVPMHMAAAMQTPTVALFGPSGDIEWGPWQVLHRLLTEPLSCRPCGKDGCGGGKISECLTLITPQRVVAAVQDILKETA
jgi:heptosyltransferase-3